MSRGVGAALLVVVVVLCVDLQRFAVTASRRSRAAQKRRAHYKRSFPKYKSHPIGPEDDPFGHEVYPLGLYDDDDVVVVNGRAEQADHPEDERRELSASTCFWQGTINDTSCGAETEAECYMTALEHEAAGTAETMNLLLDRRYIDDTCANSVTANSGASYPHPRIDFANETDPVATCCFVGQIVDPCFFDYGRSGYSCAYVVEPTHVIIAVIDDVLMIIAVHKHLTRT